MKVAPGKLHDKARSALHSRGGRNFMLYLLFVLVAFAFWVMMSLDSETQKEYDVPLQITSVPDSVTLITLPPATIAVSVKAKGSQLIRLGWGGVPTLKIDFRDVTGRSGRLYVSRSKLESRLREYFGAGVTISSIRPDTLSLVYTGSPGIPVKLHVPTRLSTDLQCIISGPVRASTDSVMVYTTSPLPKTLEYIETEPVALDDLRDTTTVAVKVRGIKGARIIPSEITVTIPVEPLISKSQSVMVDVRDVPPGERVLTFPSKVDVTYLVPMSCYNADLPVRAYVDYQDTRLPGDKVPVRLGALPDNLHNVTACPDSVEYLIEKAR